MGWHNESEGMTVDQYTPIIQDTPEDPLVPKWVSSSHRRRYLSYQLLDQLDLQADKRTKQQEDDDVKRTRFGEVAFIIDALRDTCIGGKQQLLVPGADAQGTEGDAAAQSQQEEIRDWAKRSKFFMRLQVTERYAALHGDGFYRLRYGRTRGADDVKIDAFHPAFVFPQWNMDGELTAVAFAWEEAVVIDRTKRAAIYKDEYVLEGKEVYETAAWYSVDGASSALDDLKVLQYDKNTRGEVLNNLLVKTDGIIPVFHIPNVPAEDEFGRSDLINACGLVTEINATNVDMTSAAALLGVPPLVVDGLKARVRPGADRLTEITSYGAGTVLNVEKGGKAEFLDNSGMLTCLAAHELSCETKLFRHVRLGKLFSGHTENLRDIESQKAVKTLMASLYALIAQKRTIREQVYGELFKTVGFMLAQARSGTVALDKPILIDFGNVLPMDNLDDLQAVVGAYAQGKGILSVETAVKMGAAAGTGVTDIKREVAAVEKQSTADKQPQGSRLFKMGGQDQAKQ